MGKGKKVRLITVIVVVALLLTTQYRTIYEVVMSSSFVQAMIEYTVSDNSVEENGAGQIPEEGGELENPDENQAENQDGTTDENQNEEQEDSKQEGNEVSNQPEGDGSKPENNDEDEAENTKEYDVQIQIEDKTEGEELTEDTNDGLKEETVSDNEIAEIEVSMNDLEELDRAGASLGSSEIPTEVDAFITWYSQKPSSDKKVHISTYQDWNNVETISKKMDLKGYEFQIDDNKSPSATDAKLHSIGGSIGFTGIGSAEFPFRGTLTGYLATGLSIETNVPIFAYLSTESNLSNLHICAKSATAALAAHVVEAPQSGAEGVTGIISLSNIRVSGKIVHSAGAAGGLFGEIRNNCATPLKISVTKFNNTGVTFDVDTAGNKLKFYGVYSGAIAGIVSGNVEYEFDAEKYDFSGIYHFQGSPAPVALTNSCVDLSGITLGGANGLLFGLVIDSNGGQYKPTIRLKSSEEVDTVTIPIPYQEASTAGMWGYGSNGGLIGYFKNGTLDASTQKIVVEGRGVNGSSDVRGSASNGDAISGYGGIVGILQGATITQGSRFEVRNLLVRVVKLTNDYSAGHGIGGFFGIVEDCVIPQATGDEPMFRIENCFINAQGNTICYGAGGFAGIYKDTIGINNTISGIEFSNVGVMTQNATGPSVGTIIGLCNVANGNSLTISDWNLGGVYSTSNVGTGAGGAIGLVSGLTDGAPVNFKLTKGTIDTAPVADAANTYTDNKFIIWDDTNQSGGLIGILDNANCEIDNVQVKGIALRTYSYGGGIIGEIKGTQNKKHVYVSNITFDLLNLSCNSQYGEKGLGAKGLLFGKVGANTIVKLDGDMDFSDTKWYWSNVATNAATYHMGTSSLGNLTQYVGSIAGIQEQAVIYIDSDCNFKPYEYDGSDSNASKRLRYVDEVGNFGGAFRNITDGSSYVFDEDEVIGTVTKSGDSYQLKSEADFLRLAVAWNSEGAFGTKSFDAGSSDCSAAGAECYDELLESKYVLTASAYDLTGTGIVCMQRSIGEGTSSKVTDSALTEKPSVFKGCFSGQNAGTQIKHTIDLDRQQNQGLFAHVGTNSGSSRIARYENLKIKEDIISTEFEESKTSTTASYISKAGLSVYARGNIVVDNCEFDINMTSQSCSGDADKTYYAGLFGEYKTHSGSKLTLNQVVAKGTKIVRDNDHYLSQLIACVDTSNNPGTLPTIEMTDITVSGSVENTNATTTCCLGGLIAVMNEEKSDGSIHKSWDSDKGRENWQDFENERTILNIDGLTISDFTLKNSSGALRSSGLLGFWWLDVDATLKNVVIGEAGKPNTLNTNKRFGGLINEVTGRLIFDKVSVKYTTMKNTNSVKHSAVLVAVAEKLFLVVRDYDTDETTIVNRTNTEEFDEVVGHTKQSSVSGYDSYSFSEGAGGVVSIESSAQSKSLVFDDTYNSYERRITYQKNGATLSIADIKKIPSDGTRYYYDLTSIMENSGDLTDAIISTPEELMRWHLLHYARTPLRKYVSTEAEFADIETVRRLPFTITGTIDLQGYSYYPTTISNRVITGDNARIIFYAQNIIDKENADDNRYRQPYDGNKQHYMLHAGLFYKVTACNISKLTLSGTVSERKNGASGALICSDINGVAATSAEDLAAKLTYSTNKNDYTYISEIVLDNLWIAKEDDDWGGDPYGLMIDTIASGAKVEISKVSMVNYVYGEDVSPTRKKYAARALIGVVGKKDNPDENDVNGIEALKKIKEIKVKFEDMDIADINPQKNISNKSSLPLDLQNATDADKVLRNASLICKYNYYKDTSAIYIFTKADYLKGKGLTCDENDPDKPFVDLSTSEGYITMGKEIDGDTEYIDEEITTKIVDDKYGFDTSYYNPYVYEYKEVMVNPKPGHITEGCGTYEDPYIIRTDKQIQSLYYYLTDQTDALLNWYVNEPGTDNEFCNKNHPESEYKIFDGVSEFPSKDKFNQAYYLIAPREDATGKRELDLTEFSDFLGFGTSANPFIGVFVGGKASDGSLPVIQLPGFINNGNAVETFGLVAFSKGCVVKDLCIEFNEADKIIDDKEGTYRIGVQQEGGGVIGNVCGGDNVIDNVVVRGKLGAIHFESEGGLPKAEIGGYVGCVDLGCVILRNIKEESLKDFQILDKSGASVANQSSYMWTGGIIGRVKDGTVVYEGLSSSTASHPVVGGTEAVDGFAYQNDAGLKASPNYGILNAEYLKNSGKVTVELDWVRGRLDIRPQNEGQLMLTAMALNTGAMSYGGYKETELDIRFGYGADSRCRNGQYDTVGRVVSAVDGAYQDAIVNDNWNGAQQAGRGFFRPYVFEYYNAIFTDHNGTIPATMSHILFCFVENAQFNDKSTLSCYPFGNADLFYLQLAEGKTYDMTVLKDSFRGIGGVYYENYNTFVGNVDGNNSTIHLSYISNASKDMDHIGLFNTIRLRKQTNSCYMKDFTITGELMNTGVVSDVTTLTDDVLNGNSVYGKSAAGLIGYLEIENDINPSGFSNPYNYSFENICVKDMTIQSQEYGAGLIGSIAITPKNKQDTARKSVFVFNNCVVGEDTIDGNLEGGYGVSVKASADVGGFIASYRDAIDVTFHECQVYSTDLQACGMHIYEHVTQEWSSNWKYVYPSAGGFIGRGVGTGKTITVEGGGFNKLNLRSKGHMGGIIGETESTLLVNASTNEKTFVGDKLTFSGNGNVNELSIGDDVYVETTLNADGTINIQAVNYNRTKYVGSFGGVAGFVSGSGTTVNHVTLTNVSGTLNYGRKDKTFMGGLIGRLYQKDNAQYTISNCVIGSADSTLSLKATDASDPSAQRAVSVGGLVGNIECAGTTNITNCSVIGNGNSVLQGTLTAAGMTGFVHTYGQNGQKIYYDNCIVKGLELNGYLQVAGVEGARAYDVPGITTMEISSTFHAMDVKDCDFYVYGLNEVEDRIGDNNISASGGLVAITSGQVYAVDCDIQKVNMKGHDVYATGGVVGRTQGTYGHPKVAKVSVTDCTFMGACTGGIAGRVDSTQKDGHTSLSDVFIKDNKLISYYEDTQTSNMTTHVQYLGGVYGYWKNTYSTIMGDNIVVDSNLIGLMSIKDGVISRYNYVGGFAGALECSARVRSVEFNNNIVSILDRENVINDADGTVADYLASDAFGIWSENGGTKVVTEEKVTSVYPRMFDSVQKKLVNYEAFADQDEALPYQQNIGLMFGYVDETILPGTNRNVWVTDVKVSYLEELQVYRPATDVGMQSNTDINKYRSGYHIVYGENTDYHSQISEAGVDNESIPNAMGIGEGYYQFGDLLKLWQGYQDESDKKFAYRLGAYENGDYYQGSGIRNDMSIAAILTGTYYDGEGEYRSIYTNADGDVIPMLKYDNNEAGLDVTINTVLAVLTNNGGLMSERNAANGSITSVTPIKMVVTDGVVSQATDENLQPSISIAQGDRTALVCNVNSIGYDEFTDSKNGTFTVLRVKYQWKYGGGNNSITYNAAGDTYTTDATQEMIVDIPIYLERVLEYQTHFTGVLGSEYYVGNLLTNGKNNLLTLKDTYTAYVEYVYNDAYDKYNSKMTKEICYKRTQAAGYEEISEGTKFILIDLTNNGHAYYYKVERDMESVPFSAFEDANGNSYQEIPISLMNAISSENMDNTLYMMHENTDSKSMPSSYYATQQYIILVDSSEVVSEVENYAYQFVVQPIKNENETLLKRSIEKKCPKACKLEITEYQGLSGAFDEDNTNIEGEISPESSVKIDLDYTISAPTAYWNYLSANKDSTLAQYLDVAIYLEQNGNRVALPTGTQVVFTNGADEPIVGVMQGNTIVYQYKDSGKVYDLNELSCNTRIQGTIELDFSSADFSGFNSGEYNVVLELLKTKDADFPMGGDVLDTYQLTVDSITKKNLGFAIEPEDLLTLGMNGYLPEESDRGVIDCDMRIDFSDYYNMFGIPTSEMNALEQKYFTVEFSLEKKVKGANGILRYEPYNGDLVKLYFGNSQKENLENYDGSKVVYKFEEGYISSSQREEKYVVSFPYTVKVDVDGLIGTYDDITNYRVVANLYLSDDRPSGTAGTLAAEATEGCEVYISPNAAISSGAEAMEDFFVFTIAKIKTDLDLTK